MRFLALETDVNALARRYCSDNEQCVYMTYYHGLSFFFAIIRETIITVLFALVILVCWLLGLPMLWVFGTVGVLWFLFVFFNLLRAYIDWYCDFVMLTTDKLILVDQTSVFKLEVKPILLDNIGSVSNETQFWNMFDFGIVRINLKEGEGGSDVTLKYVPRADELAQKISDAVTRYERYQASGHSSEL